MCLCTIFYDNNQNNFSNGAAWSTMKNDVTDGAIYFNLFLSCPIFRKKLLETNLKKKLSILLKEKTNKQIDNRVFSHDVTAAILVSQNNETAAMLVSQTSPVGVELFS